jgi:hypothetical protein
MPNSPREAGAVILYGQVLFGRGWFDEWTSPLSRCVCCLGLVLLNLGSVLRD